MNSVAVVPTPIVRRQVFGADKHGAVHTIYNVLKFLYDRLANGKIMSFPMLNEVRANKGKRGKSVARTNGVYRV